MKVLKFLLGFVLVCGFIIGGCYVYPRYIEPNLLVITNFEQQSVTVEKPLKIVVFGDTHFGELYSLNHMNKIVNKVNKENPDIVIFTGDLIGASGNFKDHPSLVSQGLDKIQSTYGKYAVYGNHEYAVESKYGYDYTEIMNAGGFDVLVNDYIDIPEINVRVLGLDDYIKGFPDRSLGEQAKDEAYNILVTHEPDLIDEMNVEGTQLILAGHTHGGQISIPFLTQRILPLGGEKYVKGNYAIGETTDLFVTRGVGMTQIPFRFGSVPEIVSIEVSP